MVNSEVRTIPGLVLISDSRLGSFLKTSAMVLPLILVLVAAGLAATPEAYRPGFVTRLISNYPLQIDLEDVARTTAFRDSQRLRAEEALRAREAAERAREDADLRNAALEEARGQDALLEELGEAGELPDYSTVRAREVGETLPDSEHGVMAIDFDLAGGPQSAGSLRTLKHVRLGEEILGEVEIRIDNNSTIYISRDQMLRILPSPPSDVQQLSGDFVMLSSLRQLGVDLRYDATGDSLVLMQ